MIVGLNKEVYEKVKNEVGGWGKSKKWMRMADGALVPGIASWQGVMKVKDLEVETALEVFDSGEQWDLLFGKPLLERFEAVHDYGKDMLVVKKGKEIRRIFNEGLGKRVEVKRTAKPMVANVIKVESKEEDAQLRQKEQACNHGRVTGNTEAPRSREVSAALPYENKEIPTHEHSQTKAEEIDWDEVEREYRE
ncbi:hypothetical protein AAF712_003267 [Marasmius tenuissimus]|uniref:Uncharacterized protein n=1 Tax=Marasmius tenuissimus TaxID=585030 RepID=A0ABR3A9E6_9AGAR